MLSEFTYKHTHILFQSEKIVLEIISALKDVSG